MKLNSLTVLAPEAGESKWWTRVRVVDEYGRTRYSVQSASVDGGRLALAKAREYVRTHTIYGG